MALPSNPQAIPKHRATSSDQAIRRGPAATVALTSLSGLVLIGFHNLIFGWPLLAITLIVALMQSGRARSRLMLIVTSVAILGITDINTAITTAHIIGMGATLALAVAIPYFALTYVFHDDIIRFPFRLGRKWYRYEIGYVLLAGSIAYLLLPVYLASTGAYHNWTVLPGTANLFKLFMGTNALGIWDELFFVITVLAVFRKSLPFIWANVAQAVLWTAFLFELGFRGWAPIAIFPFALLQGYIFKRTDSLLYILTIHLTVDFVLYLALIHAYYPSWLPIFIT
jgi:membrane protease YdiL (CAAX protease family)